MSALARALASAAVIVMAVAGTTLSAACGDGHDCADDASWVEGCGCVYYDMDVGPEYSGPPYCGTPGSHAPTVTAPAVSPPAPFDAGDGGADASDGESGEAGPTDSDGSAGDAESADAPHGTPADT